MGPQKCPSPCAYFLLDDDSETCHGLFLGTTPSWGWREWFLHVPSGGHGVTSSSRNRAGFECAFIFSSLEPFTSQRLRQEDCYEVKDSLDDRCLAREGAMQE